MLKHLNFKIEGVTKRWLVNVMSVVVAAVIVIEVVLGILFTPTTPKRREAEQTSFVRVFRFWLPFLRQNSP